MATTYNFSEKQLKMLSSTEGLKLLAQSQQMEPAKVLKTLQYEATLEKLQIELIKLQTWVIEQNKRICILFEGRDSAGKGGAIRRVTHHLNPRYYKVIALPKPTRQEKGQWYFQRYINRLPNPGEIVLFDRSWYNRAVVEPVNGFCTDEEYQNFMKDVNHFESMITNDGLILIKFYFSISKAEQAKRFKAIKVNPLKRWKMSPVDEQAQKLWPKYTTYKEAMFTQTNTNYNPWIIIKANKKMKARVEAIKHILNLVPYKENS
ncbi:polyphosphate kinase 2 [Fulvivirga sp. RKSG066]|uniref:polyphosphate kinase 2 n=1 Tax=Fulvivirga aurantia TaxID=2529383 RepID=UPI0012BBB548|nr:polyphosphate kinase 2 [Fulvivirga aurantia]MTI23208.1 polyphosphate kinase 2 [Fulvivirga aurantia]